jgi:glucose/arabinose dehydrogenase
VLSVVIVYKGSRAVSAPVILEHSINMQALKTSEKTAKSLTLGSAFMCLPGFWFLSFLVLAMTMPGGHAAIEAERVATGLTLPLYVCAPPGDFSRIFVAEQHGQIKIVDLTTNTVLPTPFLDISSEVGQGQGTGILGMTFDPNYSTNGFFYVSYTTDHGGVFNQGVSHVARFTVSSDPNVADPGSEVTVITADQPAHAHNWDWIGFSPRAGDENNLYICSGDGGVNEDDGPGTIEPDGNAQSTETLLGKILRIHIEDDGSYTIPLDNPFFGSQTEKQEIFAYGLRNPFRASFVLATGDMLIGDVGEHNREEVDVSLASNPGGGENYGWRYREGFIQNPFYEDDPPPPNAVDPIIDYEHSTIGICVIGGYVYHGSEVSELEGLYVFGDCFGPDTGDFTGRIFTLRYEGGVASEFTDITAQLFPTKVGGYNLTGVTSLGEDASGELYITSLGGDVFKIMGTSIPTPTPTPSPSPSPTPTPSPTPSPSPTPFFPVQLGNISTRLDVGTGENVAIGGFIVTGTQAKQVVVRALGPSLPLGGVLADPILELHDSSGETIASNDNWPESANQQAIIDAGFAPGNDKESAILMALEPGLYTAIVRGVGGTSGVALVEAYDLDRTINSKLANISTRGFVQTGENVMIGGLIILGDGNTDILVRAIGPTLANVGVDGALEDPILELHDKDGSLIVSNDDWKEPQQAQIEGTGLAPTDDRESAILATLSPDSYTAIVRGKSDTTGVALVEVYNVSP